MKSENRIVQPKFRHELKYFISQQERQVMTNRLQGLMERDANGTDKGYTIRSLYFDDYWMSAYQEKLLGVFQRKKYRIRIYNYEDTVIKLECKEKQGSYIHKESASLTREETEQILAGHYEFLLQKENKLCQKFYVECTSSLMRPQVIVDYEREAFVFPYGDVRITFDNHVRSAWMNDAIFDRHLPVYEVLPPEMLIMEVKYTEYLPKIIHRAVSPDKAQLTAASKYTMCLEKKKEMGR